MAGPVDSYAVMGNPIEHSKSPKIHTLFAAATGQRLRYTSILVDINGFNEAVDKFFEIGDLGLSVTVPFKEEAWQLSEVRTRRAEKAGAVNTLWQDQDGRIHGDNTDGAGLVHDLQNNDIPIRNKRVLILGAGGAARGVLEPILAEEPAELVIANRTVEKAKTLVSLFPKHKVSACGFADIQGSFDLIINATAASLQGEMPPLPKEIVTVKTCCYDMMYSTEETIFNQWGRLQGAQKTLDGLGMLVEQAAEQFAIWRGIRPETTEVLAVLRNEL